MQGVHVIVDRYAFSGVAYSCAANGFSVEWAKNCDRGLPAPDIVFFLDIASDIIKNRG